ncbi:hypothetical protein OG689_41225 [Kitasatospora sp. NBC_00240]|uniref:hypothetical protein n=1 Tax=Kitasatospora sp. NBC_00240 TaxID=2903567 RepID=UPI002255115A|nr:hypothetical protein [Kitasatospora sp. NBC_00240]MCX5215578.1 hypothetical protein [Kitasatospora sp. NBC_00240]
MHAAEWIALASGVVALGAAGISVQQAWTASKSAKHSDRQAQAAEEQVRIAREQLRQAERVHREQLALAQRVHREQNEPYVVVDLAVDQPGTGLVALIVHNSGPTMARDVRIRFTPELESSLPQLTPRVRNALSRPISMLPPGRRLVYPFDTHQRWDAGNLPMEFDVTVDATGPAGPVEQLTYRIDLQVLAEALVGERPHQRIESSLGEIADKVEELASKYGQANSEAIRAEHRREREGREEREECQSSEGSNE